MTQHIPFNCIPHFTFISVLMSPWLLLSHSYGRHSVDFVDILEIMGECLKGRNLHCIAINKVTSQAIVNWHNFVKGGRHPSLLAPFVFVLSPHPLPTPLSSWAGGPGVGSASSTVGSSTDRSLKLRYGARLVKIQSRQSPHMCADSVERDKELGGTKVVYWWWYVTS